jgi:hypothetical protein
LQGLDCGFSRMMKRKSAGELAEQNHFRFDNGQIKPHAWSSRRHNSQHNSLVASSSTAIAQQSDAARLDLKQHPKTDCRLAFILMDIRQYHCYGADSATFTWDETFRLPKSHCHIAAQAVVTTSDDLWPILLGSLPGGQRRVRMLTVLEMSQIMSMGWVGSCGLGGPKWKREPQRASKRVPDNVRR